MLLILLNGVDITDKVDYNSIKISEQMNNRANTCSFGVTNYMVPEGALIEIWEGSELSQDEVSGTSTIHVDETYEYFQKYRIGDSLKIPAGSSSAITRVIQSIDHTNRTITFTTTLGVGFSRLTQVGRLIFAGVTMKNPDDEIGKTGILSYKVQAVDFTKIFDAKNVVDTFEDQYPREVIGRVVHKFTANDTFLEISDAETTTLWSGIGAKTRAPGTSSTDKVWKNNSITGGATAAGTIIYRYTPASPVNITAYTHIRAWIKIAAGQLASLTLPKFRAVTSAGNYLEWSDMIQVEDCWSYDSFIIANGVATGTPNLASIAYYEYQWTATTAVAQDGIKFDQISVTTGGFTIRNVMRGDTKYADIRAQYKKPTVLLEDLAKLQKLYWYVDYERDIHFFDQESYTCPMEILDSSEVYDNLSVTADISQLKNRQVVRGGEAVDSSLYTQDEVTDGKQESWRLDYKPQNLSIYVDTTGTGSSYVLKSVGVENLDAATSFDYLYNFNEKIVKRASAPVLAAGSLIRRTYYPYRPIRVQVENAASIIAIQSLLGGDGIFDGAVINDGSIRDFTEARSRAKAEIEAYANPIITATWTSEQDGWQAGQIVRIQDSNRLMDDRFLIQKVSRNQNTNGRWQYNISAGSTMFGLIEFFQLLLKRSDKLMIDVSELVDIVKTIDETVVLSDAWIFKKKSGPWYAHTYTGQYNISLTGTEGGTAQDAYAGYCEAS